MFKAGDGQEEAQRSGPKNMLDQLENSFNELQLETLRLSPGKNQEGTQASAQRMEEPPVYYL